MRHPAAAALAPALALAVALAPGPMAGAQPTAPPAAAPLVRLPFPQDDGTLTPYTFDRGYQLVTLVYDTLFWRDENGVPQPWLAQGAEPSADELVLTVRLTPGATWHDGAPVTSTDVAFTFDFVARRRHPRFSPQVSAVERVETPDPATAVIRLRHPSPGFLDQPLADVPILPAHLWRDLPRSKPAPDGLPVGSGPYRLAEYRNGEGYRFEANPGYFRGSPAVTTIEVPVIRDAEEAIQAMTRREVDMIPLSLPDDAIGRVDAIGTAIERGPAYLGTVLLLNLRQPPFADLGARRAVAEAIDVGRLARRVGNAVPAGRGYLHPTSDWASSDSLVLFRPGGAPAGGVGASEPIPVLAPEGDPVKVLASRQIAAALGRRGIPAESRPLASEEFSRAIGERGDPPTFRLAVSSSPALASHDPDFLGHVFGSDPARAPLNYSGYRSPEFDALAERIASTVDAAARRQAVDEALRLLARDVPVVPLFFANGAYAYRSAVFEDWVFVKGTGILDKRSFLPQAAPATGPSTTAVEVQDGNGDGGGLGLVALGLLVAAAGVAAAALLGRRR